MTRREFKEAEARHVAHGHRLIERIHRHAAANRLAREAECLRDQCRDAGEPETAEWLDSCKAAAQGAIKTLEATKGDQK